jgi:hypothetical protein
MRLRLRSRRESANPPVALSHHLRGLMKNKGFSEPAEAGFVCVAAISNRQDI